MTGIFLLLLMLAVVFFAFLKMAIYLSRYYNGLKGNDEHLAVYLRRSNPRMHSYMRHSLPIVIICLYVGAVFSFAGVCYVVGRYVNDFMH